MTISVHVEGKIYDAFTEASVSRSLDKADSELSLTVAAWEATRFPPGSAVRVMVDDVPVINGYFCRFRNSRSARQSSTSLVIRSKTGDLVDSSAEPQSFKNMTPVQVAAILARPHGVTVVSEGTFTPTPSLRVQPGETIYSVIERMMRNQYGLITDNADGEMVLTQAASAASSMRKLVVGQNVLTIDYDFDWDQRFKTYRVVGQGQGLGHVDSEQIGVFRDENAERERLLLLVGAAQQPGVNARNRAAWEKNQRIGKTFQIEVVVQGWKDANGALWSPNTMVSLTDAYMSWENIPFLLVSTKFRLGQDGAITTGLSLRPRQAYESPEKTAARGKGTLRANADDHFPYVPVNFGPPWLTDGQMRDIIDAPLQGRGPWK